MLKAQSIRYGKYYPNASVVAWDAKREDSSRPDW